MRGRSISAARVAAAIAATMLVMSTRGDGVAGVAAGKGIYLKGESVSGPEITATIAEDASPVAAPLLPCVNCHGRDGAGKPEGGVAPSKITWLELTKPYRLETVNGRRRPPYTDATLARAISTGVDSAGNALNGAMPHYTMSPRDMTALIDYLKILGRDAVAGVTSTTVRVGTIVPRVAAGERISQVLQGVFSDAGEIHGRRIELTTIELPSDRAVAGNAVESAIAANHPFALVGGLINGVDATVNEVVERAEVPLILPITSHSDNSSANRQRFYLHAGVEEQVAGLVRFLDGSRKQRVSRIAIVARRGENLLVARKGLARSGNAREIAMIDPDRADFSQLLSTEMKHADAILILDRQFPLESLVTPMRKSNKAPALLFLGELLPRDFFAAGASLQGVMVALPTSPVDMTTEGLAGYHTFAEKHGIGPDHLAAQLSTYVSAKVLLYALQKSGRDLTPESFRSALESVYEFDTGIAPPLSFGRNRHIGSTRVDVATIDSARRLSPIGHFEAEP